MERLVQIDRQFSLWLNQGNPQCLDGFWSFFSGTREWIPLYILVMVFLIWKLGWKKGLIVILTIILGVVLTDRLSVFVKESVLRPRPCRDAWMIAQGVRTPDGVIGGLHGFFSSHASNVFGFASGTWLGLKLNDREHSYGLYAWFVFIWAAIVSLSRVMLAAHYFGDITVGALFGTVMGAVLAFCARWLIVKAKV